MDASDDDDDDDDSSSSEDEKHYHNAVSNPILLGQASSSGGGSYHSSLDYQQPHMVEDYYKSSPSSYYNHGGDVDLEQILRETDEDDEDDDEDDIMTTPRSGGFLNNNPEDNFVLASRGRNGHGAEEWDVLQAILGEDEDDEDGILTNGYHHTRSSSSSYRSYTTMNDSGKISTLSPLAPSSGGHVVDAILQQSDADDDEDDTMGDYKYKEQEEDDDSPPPSNTFTAAYISNPIIPSTTSEDSWKSLALIPSDTVVIPESAPTTLASDRALAYAQAYEKKLFQSHNRDIVSPLQIKRRLKPKIELNTKTQLQSQPRKKTTTAQPRFGFSGIVENKRMSGISNALSNKDLPTALCLNSRFLAIGTVKGIVLVFDWFEVLRQTLSIKQIPDAPKGSVTTLDMAQGEILAAGYTSGLICLWDSIKGVPLKTVLEHSQPSPMTCVRFLNNDLKLITVDAGGLVNSLKFRKNLFGSFGVETECLLDGTAGQILAMNALEPYQNVSQKVPTTNSSMKRTVLIALSSERSSFAVAVEPTVHVLHRWAKPEKLIPSSQEADDPQVVYLPCLSWAWALVSGGSHNLTPILARGWGCCLQFLQANFMDTTSTDEPSLFQWPAFGVQDEFETTAPVVAMEWLSERSLVYLTLENEFTVIDTVMMTLLERLDFSGYPLVYAEFSLSRKNSDNGDLPLCTTFQNSIRACDNRLLLLCQEEVKSVSIIGDKRRISVLEEDGEWLESLALALDYYETTILSQQDRKRVRGDISKHPSQKRELSEDEEWVAKLLIRYLNIAVDNAPAADYDLGDLAQSHFQMLAGVCVEFCVVTKRLDLLFGPIFQRFHSVGFLHVFLDVLEPYILNDKLDYIAPEAMAHFVEHCRSATKGIETVERCLLHMDVTIMDFDTILSLLRANEMYSALFYVFNQGLHDFTTPLEILLEKIFDAADTGACQKNRRGDGAPQNDFERYGYKAILYLQQCFKGRTFPQDLFMEEEQCKSVRLQLLRFLLQDTFSPSRNVKKPSHVFGQRALRYPYAHILLMVDPKAMFDTISIAMNAPGDEFGGQHFDEGGWEVEVGGEEEERPNDSGTKKNPTRQEIVTMFLSIIIPEKSDVATTHQTTLYQSKMAVNALLDFLAVYLMKGVVRANQAVTFQILQRMANRYQNSAGSERQEAQKQILQLLTALPRNSYESDQVLELVQTSGIHRAALLLHQEGASSWNSKDSIERRSEHFRLAIDCYLEDEDVDFRKEVFGYVKKECSGATDHEESTEYYPMRDALLSKLEDLVHLDALLTAELVAELFVEDLDLVISTLKDDKEAQFMFMQAVISGDLNEMDQVAGAVLNAHLTMEHHHKYLALMAKLHPELVYDYLSAHDNYRPEECLQLCQKYDIADASAYLLERMGNVSSALQLILQTLESRMMGLKRTIRGMGTSDFLSSKYTSGAHRGTPSQRWKKQQTLYHPDGKQAKEIEGVKRILIVALDLCARNSGTFSSRTEHGSQLWFNVLDRLINAKGFLRLSKEQAGHAKVMAGVLSELLRLTMQRMVSSVPLPDLVRKVTSDHSGSRLGELREMIESLLSTYGLELNVFSGAVNVFHHDSHQMQNQHRALRVRGASVKVVSNIPLDTNAIASAPNKTTLENTLNSGHVLQLAETGNASVVAEDADSSFHKTSTAAEQGLGTALAKLRSRRRRAGQNITNITRPVDRCRASGLNFMDDKELSYTKGELSHDATFFEDRQSGLLGEAEHRGRLMSFMY